MRLASLPGPVRVPALLAATLAVLACWAWSGGGEAVEAPVVPRAQARVQPKARAADLRREPRLQDERPGALRTDVGPLQLPAPSVRGGMGFSAKRVGGLGPVLAVRLAAVARAPAQPRAPERPLPVNRLADHPDLHTCPSCGPPERS